MVLARAKLAVSTLPFELSYLSEYWIVQLLAMTSLMQSSRMYRQATIIHSLILFLQNHRWSSLPPRTHSHDELQGRLRRVRSISHPMHKHLH